MSKSPRALGLLAVLLMILAEPGSDPSLFGGPSDAQAAAPDREGKARFSPRAYIPFDAPVVLHWKDPAGTLLRFESLAAAAGLAPPQARPGWVLASLREQAPWIEDVDLSRPIWLAARSFPSEPASTNERPRRKRGPTGEPAMPEVVVIAGVKGSAERLRAKLAEGGRSMQSGGWLVATSQKGKEGFVPKEKRPFAFPPHLEELDARSDLILHFDPARIPAARLEADAELDPTSQAVLQRLRAAAATTPMTVGLGLGRAGAELFLQQHPEPKSALAAWGQAVKNAPGTLIRGLPPDDYALVLGMRTSPKHEAQLIDAYVRPILDVLSKERHESAELIEILLELARGGPGACTESSFGMAVPGPLDSAYFVAQSRCENAEKADGRWPEAAKAANRGLERLGARERKKLGLRVRAEDNGPAVAGVRFKSVRLIETKGSNPLDEAPPMVRAPLLHAAVDRSAAVSSWNAPSAVLERLVAAAKANEATPMPTIAAAQAQLISPRVAEGYLRLGTLASGFLPEELAPLRILLMTLPPVAWGSRTFPDGSLLTQVWLPRELAQLAAVAMQLLRESEAPEGFPMPDEPQNDLPDPEEKEI